MIMAPVWLPSRLRNTDRNGVHNNPVITGLNTETRSNFLAWFAGWPVETMTSSQTGSGARVSINGGDGLAASFETTHQEPRFTQMLVL